MCHETDDAKHNLAHDGSGLRWRHFLQLLTAVLRAVLCLTSAFSVRCFSSGIESQNLAESVVDKQNCVFPRSLRCTEELKARASIKAAELVNANKQLTLLLQ